ncbi:MAG TPA: ELWxxDGT repeat protein [Candidatus Binatia bacterium]
MKRVVGRWLFPVLILITTPNAFAGAPMPVEDINSGTNSAAPSDLTAVGDKLFFTAFTPQYGRELWTTDGTSEGTKLVKDFYPGPNLDGPANLTAVDDWLFFTAYDDKGSPRLWRSDSSGKDVRRIGSGFVVDLANINGTLFFTTSTKNGAQLWKINNNLGKPLLVKSIKSKNGAIAYKLTNVVGTVYFLVYTKVGTKVGYKLWKSDGTTVGTVPVRDFPGEAVAHPDNLTNVNGTLFFTAYSPETGSELWKSDGTEEGTVVVKDIYSGPGSSDPMFLVNGEALLYFLAFQPATGYQLWRSDGTSEGTFLVGEIVPKDNIPNYFRTSAIVNGKRTLGAGLNGNFFLVIRNFSTGAELWSTDGLSTERFLSLTADPLHMGTLTAVDDMIVFSGNDGVNGSELWVGDGESKARMIEIAPGPGSSAPSNFTAAGNNLFFVADDGVTGRELWVIPIAALHDALNN